MNNAPWMVVNLVCGRNGDDSHAYPILTPYKIGVRCGSCDRFEKLWLSAKPHPLQITFAVIHIPDSDH